MQEKWFPCQVIDRYYKDKWFGGRKYFIVVRIPDLTPSTFTFRANEEQYYNQDSAQIKMYSLDGTTWASNPAEAD